MRALHVFVAGALVAGALATACAALLGFEDAVDLRDGGGALFDVTADGLVGPSEAAGMVCVPTPPDLWQGPLILFAAQGASLPPPPDCPAPYVRVYDGHANPTGPPADCKCTCGAPTNVACSPPMMNLFNNLCVAGSECATPHLQLNTTCTNLQITGCGAARFTIDPSTPAGGSCAPSQPTAMRRPSSWSVEVRLCALSGATPAGCPAGKVATPATGLPFDPTYCVTQRTDTQCPPTYPTKRTYYEAYTDDRGCDPCTCDPPTGVMCGGTVTTGDSNTCARPMTYTVPLTTCTNGLKPAAFFTGDPPVGGSCAPQNHPKGGLTPNTPTTVCCVQ